MFAITNGKVIIGHAIVDKCVIINNGFIEDVCDKVSGDMKKVDANGCYVSPGFIDVHIHGFNGFDTMDATFEALNTISKSIVKNGVTSFLPTTMTQSIKNIQNAVNNVSDVSSKVEGAQIAGLHMEGPFISKEYKGAQPDEYIIAPSIENFNRLCNGNEEIVKLITLAPELDGSAELIKYLVSKNITASMGHTNSTYNEAINGINNGISHTTHTYNAMKGFTHREPGTVGAVFDSNVTAELICDGIHVHWAALRALLKQKGIDKSVLITDCIRAGGLQDGKYELGGQDVFVKDKAARLANGALAGSTLRMNTAVYNAVHNIGVSLPEAVAMATINPAKVAKLNDRGLIEKGKVADIIIFDENIEIKNVFIKGQKKL